LCTKHFLNKSAVQGLRNEIALNIFTAQVPKDFELLIALNAFRDYALSQSAAE
jgi:hypothetical protein